ncbi:MAG: peptidoglycan-binding protein [Candidatus Kaiserbacteria bacterium]|nr:peptidoglycan-binding protein [Candidatus Kaiserbacteria bacterium]
MNETTKEIPIEDLPNPGALIDTRTEAAKAKDYKFGEIVSAIEQVVWVEKPQSAWRKFPIFNQNGSGSCVAQTLRKLYGVYLWLKTGVWVDISGSHIYQRRSNRPAAGMGGEDVFTIGQKGTTLNSFAPSDDLTDSQMDAMNVIPFMEKIGETFKLGKYVVVSPTDIDTIASIIQATGKAVMVWFYFKYDEWTNVPTVIYPNLDQYASSTLRHSLGAVDYTLLGQSNVPDYPQFWGKKSLIIDESWGLGTAMNGQRVITEDFFKARNFFAAHFMNFSFEEATISKPRYDETVVSLQNCLKYEGLFPANVESSGVFGSITTKAVNAFQLKYGLATVGTGAVGPKTKAKLHELYP